MNQSKKASLNFIEAKPAESAAISSQAAGLQLMLPNGIRIGIGAEINPVLLQTVLSVQLIFDGRFLNSIREAYIKVHPGHQI